MKAKTFLILFLAAVLLVGAASVYFAMTVDRADKSVVAIASPDNKYKAVRVRFSNDGRHPFCFDTISVFLTVYPDSFAESTKTYEVYGAPCAVSDKRATLPKMEWLSDRALRITYAPVDNGQTPRLKIRDASYYIDITYVLQK